MFATVIVPLDCSPHAEVALPLAHEEAQRHGARLVLLHVLPWPEAPRILPDALHRASCSHPLPGDAHAFAHEGVAAARYLEEVKHRYALPAATVTAVVIGEPARRIEAALADWPAPLLVLTTGEDAAHPHSPLSEVARRLLIAGTVPILGVREGSGGLIAVRASRGGETIRPVA